MSSDRSGHRSYMRVAITGATGNVGTALIKALKAEPEVTEILGIARRTPAAGASKLRYATADIAVDDLVPLLSGYDAVVNLAWMIQPSHDEARTFATNVHGSALVFEAAARAGVKTIVHASSVGAYSPGSKDTAVNENYPTGGIQTSFYSRHKAAVERELDRFERAHPQIRVVRLRPALIFQRQAGNEIRRLFMGRFFPAALVNPKLIPIVPRTPGLVLQGVHAEDVADAYRRVILDPSARGAYNIAAEPSLDADALGRLLDAKPVDVPPQLLRRALALSWRARLQPSPEGWIDMALQSPLLDSSRARDELGWTPTHDAGEALLEVLGGIRDRATAGTPALDEPGAYVER
ncbi:MAG TPA: NAD-dependent epimerase/dehydratase family protein [Baekduia sp.]|nr:NAD-dependent epimerase/dehydratase family protein [Baekduia sp.]